MRRRAPRRRSRRRPIAAWIVRHLNARVLGAAVGGFVLLTNENTFLGAVGFDSNGVRIPVYAAIIIVWVSVLKNERKAILEA